MNIEIRQMVRMVSITSCVLLASPAAAHNARPAPPPVAIPASLFVISYRAGPNWKPGVPMRDQGLREHFYYWKALDDRGMVVLAGAVGNDAGLVVLRAASQREADRVVAEDPASKAGIFIGEARAYAPRFVGKTPVIPVKP